ncbi:MAG: radical SAM protein [Deltaproteobacteria bacterium]|nr:radical SAM protein [Deltaproteobacteria bacterium]
MKPVCLFYGSNPDSNPEFAKIATKLEKAGKIFFQTFGGPKLFGKDFCAGAKPGSGKGLFEKFIKKCGYENNAPGFFKELFSRIGHEKGKEILVNGIIVPKLYLYDLLGIVMPGDNLYSIKSVDMLNKKAFVRTRDELKMQEVLDKFPVRLSDHVIRQSLVSSGVSKQYLPFIEELDPTGHIITFDGHFKKGVLEQMYQNRVIFLLDMRCPVYCRFCFRKHKSTRKEKSPEPKDVKAAAAHVKNHSSIKEVLITGGEPLLNKPSLETAINSLMKISHVETIRIATRSIAYYPGLFLKNHRAYIKYLLEKNAQCLDHGKRIEIGVHFVHPDEISIQSLDIISQFVKNGIQVYVQTPFLNRLNTNGKTLGRLFMLLRQAGAKIYYIFTPCSPIHGTREFWSPISQAFEALKYLRANFSDRCIPKLCTATPLGKIEWHTSGWAVEKDKKDESYTWIRTPYTKEYFKHFIPDIKNMPDLRVNHEGTLDARFRLDMGDDALFAKKRPRAEKSGRKPEISIKGFKAVRSFLFSYYTLTPSIGRTPSKLISRVHKTRIEMDVSAGRDELEYIKCNPDITDVVISGNGLLSCMSKLDKLVGNLKTISHITCIRLCCRQFNNCPEFFTDGLVQAMSLWCDFSIGSPVRIEIETWFCHPDEIQGIHGKIAGRFVEKGVNIYANVPIIEGLNDDPKTMVKLANRLRQEKIEFHQIYVSGLEIQEKFNGAYPADPQKVIDIASQVRKDCSGRQIPLYIVQTSLGEVDFGLNCFL